MDNINDNRINQGKIKGSEMQSIENLIDTCKSITKIIGSNGLGTGFFIKLERENKPFFCLMTNEHVVTKEMVEKNEQIEVKYNNQHETIKINLNKNERYIQDYKYLNIDVIVVEIIPKDNIQKEYFLLPNIEYLNGYEQFENKQIFIPQFPGGGNLNYSKGNIKKINSYKYEFSHLSSTLAGSSGSPIFLKESSFVLGIHKQTNEKKHENYGNFIGPVIEELKSNIKIEKQISENEEYEGEIINGKREGRGKLIFKKNGEYYVGHFKNNKFNGRGIIYYKNNKIKYEGDFIDDYYNGYGTFRLVGGYYYYGQWVNGKKHGKGKIYNKENNIIYEGDFINNKYEGKGKLIYKDGEYYIGEFKNSKRHGNGKQYYKDNKIKYEGPFINDKMEGEGKFYFEDESYYIGEFKEGKKNGQGIIYYKNNIIKYDGFFINDEFKNGGHMNDLGTFFEDIDGNLLLLFNNGIEFEGKADNRIPEGKIKYHGDKDTNFIAEIKKGNNVEFIKEKDKISLGGEFKINDMPMNINIACEKTNKNEEGKENIKIKFKNKCELGSIEGIGEHKKNGDIIINMKINDKDGKLIYEGGINYLTFLYEGYGKLIDIGGNTYIGEFKNGKFNGKGIMIKENGFIIYDGFFKNDKFEGEGEFYFENGNYFKGTFINNMPNGKGSLYNKNNKIIKKGIFNGFKNLKKYNKDYSEDYIDKDYFDKLNYVSRNILNDFRNYIDYHNF